MTHQVQIPSVLGTFSQNRPNAANSAEVLGKNKQTQQAAEPLPAIPVVDHRSNIVLMPTQRIDGSLVDAPWTMTEPDAWNWLRTVAIDNVNNYAATGSGGSLWAQCQDSDGLPRSVLIRFDTVGHAGLYKNWEVEYGLSAEDHSLLRREQAVYEMAKGLGCEDLLPPIAAKIVNLVPLLSDDNRDAVAAELGIDQLLVDETFGVIAGLQLVPLHTRSFIEYWAMLGPDDANRWQRAGDAIRHSIYRLVILDFIVGAGNRTLADYQFNEASGSLVAYGFGVTLPIPGATADRFLAQRAIGWGRKEKAPLERAFTGMRSGTDSSFIPQSFGTRERDEFLSTCKQLSVAMNDDLLVLLCKIGLELGIQIEAMAGFVARLAFLQEDPAAVLEDHVEFTRNILVPMRRGYSFDSGRNLKVVEVVNHVIGLATGNDFDFATIMSA